MTLIANEIRTTNEYTTKEGVKVVIHNVPTKFLKDEFGTEYEAHSIAVAMRLEELTNKALEISAVSGTVHELEF
jgi:hypothetical protein